MHYQHKLISTKMIKTCETCIHCKCDQWELNCSREESKFYLQEISNVNGPCDHWRNDFAKTKQMMFVKFG